MNAQKIQIMKKDKIHCSILYNIFKGWFKNNNPNIKIPSNKEFMANIKKHIKFNRELLEAKL